MTTDGDLGEKPGRKITMSMDSRFSGLPSFTIFGVSVVAGVSPGRLLIRHIDLFTAEYSRVVFLWVPLSRHLSARLEMSGVFVEIRTLHKMKVVRVETFSSKHDHDWLYHH